MAHIPTDPWLELGQMKVGSKLLLTDTNMILQPRCTLLQPPRAAGNLDRLMPSSHRVSCKVQRPCRLRHLGARHVQLITDAGSQIQQIRNMLECVWPAALDTARQPFRSKTWAAPGPGPGGPWPRVGVLRWRRDEVRWR